MCNMFIVMWKDFIGIPLIFSKNQSIQLPPTYLFIFETTFFKQGKTGSRQKKCNFAIYWTNEHDAAVS